MSLQKKMWTALSVWLLCLFVDQWTLTDMTRIKSFFNGSLIALLFNVTSSVAVHYTEIDFRLPVKLAHTFNWIHLNYTDNWKGICFWFNYLDRWLHEQNQNKSVSFLNDHLHDGAFQNVLPVTHQFPFILTNLDIFSKVKVFLLNSFLPLELDGYQFGLM